MRQRGELLERPFAHYLEAGGMRRTHLRGHGNILKRLLVHIAGFNLGILMRSLIGKGTPREYAERRGHMLDAVIRLFALLGAYLSLTDTRLSNRRGDWVPILGRNDVRRIGISVPSSHGITGFSTGC